MIKNKLKLIIAILFLFIFTNLYTYDKMLDRNNVYENAINIDKQKYPNAHDVLVDNLTYIIYNEDGLSETTDEVYIKILDEIGKQENSSINFYYNKNYEKHEILKVQIIKTDKSIIDIAIEENTKEQSSPNDSDANIYDDDTKLVTLKIPNIEIGDLIYYKTKAERIKTRIDGNYSDFFISQYTTPFKKLKIVVEAPLKNPLKHKKVLNGIEKNYKMWEDIKDDKIYYFFESKDIPQIIPEPDMPNMYEVVMRYLFTTIENWEQISKWYYELSESKMIMTDEIREKTKELIKNCETEMDKIEAIFFFVSRKVRYMGANTETNRPGLEPHPTDYTFNTMTGVCRDKAALIVVMLREAGIDANMVLINTSRKLDYEVPMSYFNHAIAGAKLKNGEIILMDPTDETTKDIFPQYLMNKSYILASKEGEDLKLTPVIPADKNILSIETTIKMKNKKMICNSEIIFKGINDNIYRHAFVTRTKDENEKLLKRIIKNFSQDSKIIEFKISPEKLIEENQELKLELKYEINDYVIENENYKIFKIPNIGDVFGAHNWLPGNLSLKERNYPIKSNFTAALKENIIFELDNSHKIEIMPDNFSIVTEGYEYNFNLNYENNKIYYERYNAMKKLEYTPIEYKKIKEVFKNIENYRKKYIILKQN